MQFDPSTRTLFADADLLAIVRADPSTCLQVRYDQPNLTLVSRALA